LFNATHQGTGTAYYEMSQKLPAERKVRLHWSEHPEKRRGLYTSRNGVLQVLDKTYSFPAKYEFRLDGKLRSPYYDGEEDRTPVASILAEELDIDPIGSGAHFADSSLIQELKERTRPPLLIGELDFDRTSASPVEFIERKQGRLRLWMPLSLKGVPPGDRTYTIGGDVSNGTGASNSALSIIDNKTGTKVGELVDAYMRPEDFAVYAVALGRWFHTEFEDGRTQNALLIWEANGPGRNFGARVLELGYDFIWYRRQEGTISKKVSDFPGWWSDANTKRELLTDYHLALKEGRFFNLSREALNELLEYVFAGNTIEHSRALSSPDVSGARENHGDRVIADSLANWGRREYPEQPVTAAPDAPPDSFEGRRRAWLSQRQTKDTW